MTGRELTDWIKENNAEDLEIIIAHRDSGGTYYTAEHLDKPLFCRYSDESFGVINKIDYGTSNPNAISL